MGLIQDLRDGKICVRNDGTPAQLQDVLHYAFPKDTSSPIPNWRFLYFGRSKHSNTHWAYSDSTDYFKVGCTSVQSFVDAIARERQIVHTNDSLEKAIREIKFRANEIGLDVEIIFKQRKKR